jgi:hypothetical protein
MQFLCRTELRRGEVLATRNMIFKPRLDGICQVHGLATEMNPRLS